MLGGDGEAGQNGLPWGAKNCRAAVEGSTVQ